MCPARSRPHWTCQDWTKLSGEAENMVQDMENYGKVRESSLMLRNFEWRRLDVQICVPPAAARTGRIRVGPSCQVGPDMAVSGPLVMGNVLKVQNK